MFGGQVLLVLSLLRLFLVTKSSTLVREDEPGAERMPIEFGYDPNSPKGPQMWNKEWPSCRSLRQSPIEINTTYVTYGAPYQIRYNQENQQLPGDLLNNGHTVAFYFEEKARYMYGVPGSPSDKYLLNDVHFHFGNDRVHGSEHSVDGHFFPVEVHLVHYNSKYRLPRFAGMMPDGIAVIAVFIEVRRGPPNHLDTFMKMYIPRVKKPSDKTVRADLNPSMLLPLKRDFYTYRGSVTVPPCKDNIRWLLMKEKQSISLEAYRALMTLKNKEGEFIAKYGNFRPLQGSSCTRLVQGNFIP